MFLTIIIVFSIMFSVFINTTIKNWVYQNIISPEIDELKDGEEPSSSLMYTTMAMLVVNNMIPFTLGAAIGLYAIL